ncbi:hypothetical protein XENTR_v10008315 [Xenopus tropicalis]|nr:hypothetical protein XENTR_v10008315 [Xenopus tropicalis]
MKIAAAFLLVAISCCFDSSEAILKLPCLNTLLKNDVLKLLKDLANVVCLYRAAQKENNAALYREFLIQLQTVLKRIGCTADQLLDLEKALENVTDQVGDVAREALQPVLELVDNLGLMANLSGLLCPLLNEPLGNVLNLLGVVGILKG